MTTRNDAANETAGHVRPAAALEAGGRPSSPASSLPHLTAGDNNETPFDPVIVSCLRILARRGRAIREERERAAAAGGAA